MYLQNKQENDGSSPPMVYRNQSVFSIKSILPSMVSPPLSLWRRAVVRSTWEVGDSLPKWKGKVVLCPHFMTCSSLYIAKLPLSSAFDRLQEGYVCDSWVVICLS